MTPRKRGIDEHQQPIPDNHRRHKRAATMPAGWSSLPSDLVSRVADVFLAASDIDYYMSLRAVCRNWRASTDDPRSPDPRFRPHGWVILHRDGYSGRCLFLNVGTGRSMWKDLPMLCKCRCVDVVPTPDGLLVLQLESRPGSKICLLNPFTGHRVRYPAVTMSQYERSVVAVGTSPLLLYLWDRHSAACIDPTDGFEWVSLFSAKPPLESFISVATYQGRPYVADAKGAVAVVEDHSGRDPRLTTIIAACWEESMPTFLVNCAGELLLVRAPAIDGHGMLEVLWVDVESKELWTVGGIKNFAIFLGDRSVCVDADKLPGIEANCIYYIGGGGRPDQRGLCVHRLKDGGHEKLFQVDVAPELRPRPLTLAQALMSYTHAR